MTWSDILLRRKYTRTGVSKEKPERVPEDAALNLGPRIRLSNKSIPEDAEIGDVIGLLSMAGADEGITWTFTIDSDPDGKFEIADDVELRVADTLDYETADHHEVFISAEPSEGETVIQKFTIQVINVFETPVNLTPPHIIGVAEVGEVLECVPGTWTDMGPGSEGVLTYQWYDAADDSPIEGATTRFFAITGEWVGESVYCRETATNSADSAAEDTETVGPFEWPEGEGAGDSFLLLDQGGVTGFHLGWI